MQHFAIYFSKYCKIVIKYLFWLTAAGLLVYKKLSRISEVTPKVRYKTFGVTLLLRDSFLHGVTSVVCLNRLLCYLSLSITSFALWNTLMSSLCIIVIMALAAFSDTRLGISSGA